MGLLDSMKCLFGNVRRASTEEAAETGASVEPQATDPAALRQVSYFTIHRDGHTFVRAYAPELEIRAHELYVLVGGEARIIASKYFLTAPEHLERAPGGDVLWMFVYDKELYPLPRGRSYFNRKFDLQVRYAPSTGGMAKLVAGRPDVQLATAELTKAKQAFAEARDQVRNFAASQGQFFQGLPPLVPAAEPAPNLADAASTDGHVEEESAALVPILPVEPPAAVFGVKKRRFKKKNLKNKEWQEMVDHLLRPEKKGKEK